MTNENSTLNDDMTFRIHPLEKNKILLRVVNLADRFDIYHEDQQHAEKFVNVMKFAKNFWQEANPGIQ